MVTIVFYEKPGCGNNTKQKLWLASSGHTVLAKNILTEKWSTERLRPFFGALPVAQWFNPAAPRVKSGEVVPASHSETEALAMMLAEPLLIRRPLMEVEGEMRAGFDVDAVRAWIGLNDAAPAGDIQACPKGHEAAPCPMPETPSPQSSPASGRGGEREKPCSILEPHHA